MEVTVFSVLAAVFFILLLVKFVSICRQMRRLPPGPFSIPFIGSICVLTRKQPLPEYVHTLTKQYGELMTIWIGVKPTVIFSSMNAIRAAFIDRQHDFASRPNSIAWHVFDRGTHNTLITEKYNERWKEMKNLTVKALKTIMTANSLDKIIENGAQEAIGALSEKADGTTSVDLGLYIPIVVYNSILGLWFGESYKLDNPEFLLFQHLCLKMNTYWDGSQYADKLPLIHSLPKWMVHQFPRVKQLKMTFDRMTRIIEAKVDRYVQNTAENNSKRPPQYLLDVFAEQKEVLEIKGLKGQDSFSPTIQRMADLFIASVDSTSNTLSWYLQYMALNPDVQERCYQDIEKVMGGRPPKLDDRQLMPYVEASILESLRWRPFNSFGFPHSCDSDQELMGYTIPKDADLLIDTFSVHFDPEVYKNPYRFDPNNFVDSNGEIMRPQNFFSFGVGRRLCVGEHVAKNNLFLILTTFLQKFEFLPVPGKKYNETPGDYAEIFPIIQPFEVVIKLRNA